MVHGAQETNSWLEQSWCGGINYTAHVTRLMQDLVTRVPELSFIDLDRVLVFARPGRSSADGAYASCHCLSLPTSDPGYFYWRDKTTGAVNELYHIDPDQDCLRRFKRTDGEYSDALHSPTYFEDVAKMVQQYLATSPDAKLVEFLNYDFEGLRTRYGAVAGTTFRYFPSYPRRYREVAVGQALPADIAAARVERFVDAVPAKIWSEEDLQLREFLGNGSRLIETYTAAVAA